MKKIVAIILTFIMIMAAGIASAATAREYTSLEDAIAKLGSEEIRCERFDINEMVKNIGEFGTIIYVRGLLGLEETEDAMLLELEDGIAAVVFPINERCRLNMDKEIIRIILVTWVD